MGLSWKSSLGGTEIRIFNGKQIVGIIKSELIKTAAYGELYGSMLRFKSKGFWKKHTQILDIEGQKQLGEIQYNLLKGTAEISFEDHSYEWSYDNWFRKSWQIKNSIESSSFVKTSVWKNEGDIENDDLPRPVLLIGLYINTVFQNLSAGA